MCRAPGVLAETDEELALGLAQIREIRLSDVVNWHGADGLFRIRPVPLYRETFYIPLADQLVRTAVGSAPDVEQDLAYLREQLEDLGAVLINESPPWIADARVGPLPHPMWWLGSEVGREEAVEPEQLGRDATFGLSCLLFALVEWRVTHHEAEPAAERSHLREALTQIRSSVFEEIKPFLDAWLDDASAVDPRDVAERCGFTEGQSDFAVSWACREVALVRA